jgi:hypothetical protein
VKDGIGTPILLGKMIVPTGHIMRILLLSGKRRGSDRILPKTYSYYLYLYFEFVNLLSCTKAFRAFKTKPFQNQSEGNYHELK